MATLDIPGSNDYVYVSPEDIKLIEKQNRDWLITYAVQGNDTGWYYTELDGTFLGKTTDPAVKKKLKKGGRYRKWFLDYQRSSAPSAANVPGKYVWIYKYTETIGTGSEAGVHSENSPAARGKDKTGALGKNGGKDSTKEAEFVNTENWDIRSNAPMLSVNYPDLGFLALQTSPYDEADRNSRSPKSTKNRDNKYKDIQSSGKKFKGVEISGGMSGAAKKVGKRKHKVSARQEINQLPSDRVRLGYIEQDPYLHSMLRDTQTIESAQKATKNKKSGDNGFRWRFKFHYNPASVSVSQSYNQEIDPLFVAKDPYAPIQSGSAVSFTLFLNRVEEMQILNPDGSFRQGADSQVDPEYAKWAWRGKVSPETRAAMRNMGTGYDLEYLYRVCNGSPQETWKGLSSDYGILFGQPLRLHFTNVRYADRNAGMNFYGFIDSLSIDHKMFSMDMVPSLTEVSISFTRIPDTIAQNTERLGKKFAV